MSKVTLTTLANFGTSLISKLNANFTALSTAMDNTLSRDGTSPNTMGADIDMNTNDLLNVGTVNATTVNVNSVSITYFDWKGAWTLSTSYQVKNVVSNDGASYVCKSAHTASATDEPGVGASWTTYWDLAASKGDTGDTGTAGADGSDGTDGTLANDWQGGWTTSTSYALGDVVKNDGSAYIATSAHTSGASTEPGQGASWATVWDIFVEKGADGTGTGTVTSVAVSGTDGIDVDSGSPITSNGTITLGIDTTTLLAHIGVESGADVTDTANVTAAGALMDSELTNITAVKTLDQGVATTDGPQFATVELGHASDTTLSRSAAGEAAVEGKRVLNTGDLSKQTIFIPSASMLAATTNGPASADIEATTNSQNYTVLDFDASTDEYAHFQIAMPKGWDEGTITFQVFWSTTATDTDGVAWGLQGVAVSDGDAIDASWGTAVVVTDDAQSAAGDVLVTAESSAVTIAGTPAAGDLCFFRLFRDVSDANDDMTEDARLVGIKILYTIDTLKDD